MVKLLLALTIISGSLFNNSHDVTSLKDWGPYSKLYSGISHIEDPDSGNMVDVTMMPGLYRRSYLVPDVLYDSGCYPWMVDTDMSRICYRYEIEWKDRVYVDATYHIVDSSTVILEMKCVNNTDVVQNILLQTMMSVHTYDEGNAPKNFFFPKMRLGENDYTLKYNAMDNWYGVATNFPYSSVKRYENSNLDFFIKRTVHRHPPVRFSGDSLGHYTSVFQRPVVLKEKSDTTIWNLIVTGSDEFVRKQIAAFHENEKSFTDKTKPMNRKSDGIDFGEQILEATLLSNIVYPIKAEGQYIRHFTPGKNWNSLYTWDSGFISWALALLDPVKSFETIRAYTTAPGSKEAFIHHGTPLPTQFFAFEELLSITSDWEMAEFMYPRLKQYYDFFAGHDKRSNTMMPSGFVRTWDLWYSTGGWDDYPPQHYLRSHKELYNTVAPSVSTAYYIRAAKILRMVANHLGYRSDIRQFDSDIAKMSNALNQNAWDPSCGYYSYVVHNSKGIPSGPFKHSDGSNFNMGLDGVSPLAAGICSKNQIDMMVENIFSKNHLWTNYGISTVDKSASYYSVDGYWNGCVWMPHQFMLWKSMLDLGKADLARKIAETALENWSRECNESYLSVEHFIIASGRGAGWHNFSGLSSPVINWFHSYHIPGTVSTGFDSMALNRRFNSDCSSFECDLVFDKDALGRKAVILVCLNPKFKYSVFVCGKLTPTVTDTPGVLEIPVTGAAKNCRIEIKRVD